MTTRAMKRDWITRSRIRPKWTRLVPKVDDVAPYTAMRREFIDSHADFSLAGKKSSENGRIPFPFFHSFPIHRFRSARYSTLAAVIFAL